MVSFLNYVVVIVIESNFSYNIVVHMKIFKVINDSKFQKIIITNDYIQLHK